MFGILKTEIVISGLIYNVIEEDLSDKTNSTGHKDIPTPFSRLICNHLLSKIKAWHEISILLPRIYRLLA